MSEAFLKIVNMSISASWLVLAVLALRLVLKKAPKWVNVLLWGIVAVRLICPVSIESILSLIPSAETVSPDIMMDWTPEVSTGIPAVDTVVNPVITQTFAPQPAASANPLQILIPVSANLWLLGILVMLGYTAVSYFLLRRKVATAVRLRDNIYQSENVASPFVLGIVRPKIYLPFRIDGGNLSHVIAHEEAHIRRKDHWWKPFGFVLLALHWFNPLMWIGYILLSRDIELACDEKVIKEMNNETKADYMEALVACSVNRRSIAACPLAFGEVGVKERVKTMMNYKKPAFWIVIAAVALCIVVAVCFLTDPKDKNNDVDVSMLELPGVKWGASIEEVKDALNLTDEQITADEMVGESDRRLVVSGLEYFGSQVDRAVFVFAGDNNGIYELYTLRLIYADDTDMNKIRDNMKEIYGTGYEFGFTDYAIHDGEAQSFINYNYSNKVEYGTAMSDDIVYKLRDNPMIHRWASTAKGTEINSQEVVDAFVALYTDPAFLNHASREEVLEWIDKHPWVTVTCSNGSTVSKEPLCSVHFTAEFIAVKRQAMAWAEKNQSNETTSANDTMSYDLPLLCYPDIAWGARPEDVKDILGVTEDQILLEDPLIDEYILWIKDISFLGIEVKSAQFNFLAKDGQYFFWDVSLNFSEETDMTMVKEKLTAFYGAPKDGVGIVRYKVTDIGSVVDYTDEVVDRLFFKGDTPVEGWWESEVKMADVLPDDVQNKLITRAIILNDSDEAFREAVQKYLAQEPAMFICCTNGANREWNDSPYYTKNVVCISAKSYISSIIN